jgi:hypothetical protein
LSFLNPIKIFMNLNQSIYVKGIAEILRTKQREFSMLWIY